MRWILVALVIGTTAASCADDETSGAESTSTTEAADTAALEESTPANTSPSTSSTTTLAPAEAQAWPWHPAGATHATPDEAIAEFVGFVGFPPDVVLGQFQQGDARSGEIEIDPGEPGESEFDASTTAFLRQGADDGWAVIGAESDGVLVEAPRPDEIIASPLQVGFVHAVPSEGVVLEIWPDGAGEPLVDQFVTQGGGVFTVDEWDIVVEWDSDASGPAVVICRSGDPVAAAVTTFRVELDA